MWLYIVAALLVVLGTFGAALGGGIFTIVLIPIGLLVAVGAVLLAMWSRATRMSADAEPSPAEPGSRPLPRSPAEPSGHAPTTPEALADARRAAQ